MTDAFVLGGLRTPVGKYGGSLSHLRTDDLLGRTMVAACEKTGVPLERIEDISAGCVNVITLATELRLRDLRYGVLGVCVGSGQGVAMVLENPKAST
jgi:acetyl-CoA acetyltransferase